MTKPLKVPLNVPKEVSDMLSSRMTAEEEESVQVELAALQAEQVRFALFHTKVRTVIYVTQSVGWCPSARRTSSPAYPYAFTTNSRTGRWIVTARRYASPVYECLIEAIHQTGFATAEAAQPSSASRTQERVPLAI